jgi:hypothetical protein
MRELDSGKGMAEVARQYQISPKRLETWKDEWRAKGELAFPGKGARPQARLDSERIAVLERKIGQQTMEIDFLKKSCGDLPDYFFEKLKNGDAEPIATFKAPGSPARPSSKPAIRNGGIGFRACPTQDPRSAGWSATWHQVDCLRLRVLDRLLCPNYARHVIAARDKRAQVDSLQKRKCLQVHGVENLRSEWVRLEIRCSIRLSYAPAERSETLLF